MIRGFPPKMLPDDDWISLSSALTWLNCRHAFELPELLYWAEVIGPRGDELRQILTTQWQELIDFGWTKEIRLRGNLHSRTAVDEITRNEWRPFRYVDWRILPQPALQLLRDPTASNWATQDQTAGSSWRLENPLIFRADVVAFKKVRRRRGSAKQVPDFDGAERDLRLMLSNVEPQTGLKWLYIEELTEVYHLPEYQAVRLWTEVSQELGFPKRGRPPKRENARQ